MARREKNAGNIAVAAEGFDRVVMNELARRRLSLAWLSRETGVSPGNLSLWRKGEVIPSAQNIRVLEETLNIHRGVLLYALTIPSEDALPFHY